MKLFPNPLSEKIKSPVAPFVPVGPNAAVKPEVAADNDLARVEPGANSADENAVAPDAADTGLSTNATPFASPADNALLPPTADNDLMDNNGSVQPQTDNKPADKLPVSDPAANTEIDLVDNQVKELSSPIQQFGESKITNNQVDDDDHEFHDTRELQDDIKTNIPFSYQNKPNNGGRNKRTRRFKVHRKKATRRYRTGK